MADRHGAPAAALTREQRLAAEIVRRFGLVPPIPLGGLVATFADLEFDQIPVSCDGLVVGLHRQRPLILLDDRAPSRRQRFTLAHELGHVLLPWHTGAFACDTRWSVFSGGGVAFSQAEPEANRFASELLVPTKWLGAIIDRLGADLVSPLLHAIEVADVSAWVACLRLVRMLPSGFVFAMVDLSGRVLLSGQSDGTRLSPPGAGERLDRRLLDRFAVSVEEVRYGARRIVWWRFGERGDDDAAPADETPSGILLDGLLERHLPEHERTRVRQSLGGVIGAANSIAMHEGRSRPDQLYGLFASRFAKDRRLPGSLIEDEDFERWLRRRAEELGS